MDYKFRSCVYTQPADFFCENPQKTQVFSAKNATSNVAAGFFDERFRRTMQPAGFFSDLRVFLSGFGEKQQLDSTGLQV
ncbi:hypothetical protein HanRHA438_Chr17g0814431 [Helianthus annuus]|nr:hypothetical protein HanRHA438_Chr17g0814431 [Helianthus annuus]